MNKISITGRITAPPELKSTMSNVFVCQFTLAVKRPHTKDETDFIPCVAWRQSAEYLSKYSRKGDVIGITGTLVSRKWDDKEGNKRTSWEIQCDTVEILSSKRSEENTAAGAETQPEFEEIKDGDAQLPF